MTCGITHAGHDGKTKPGPIRDLTGMSGRAGQIFFGPPRTDTYDIYRGKVLELLYYGKRVKAEFADETCTVSLNNYWYIDE